MASGKRVNRVELSSFCCQVYGNSAGCIGIGTTIANESPTRRSITFVNEGRRSMEFRWVVFLTLWTMLIGPVLDFTQNAPTGQAARTKTAPAAKTKSVR
jgi:hypothetical protein